jgi:hypothetical protein
VTRPALAAVLCLGLCLAAGALRAGEAGGGPLLSAEEAPDIIFAEAPLHLRLRAWLDRDPPPDPARRRREPRPAEAVLYRLADDDGAADEALGEVGVELPPYRDRSARLRFTLPPARLRREAALEIRLRLGQRRTAARLHLRPAAAPGAGLHAAGLHLYAGAPAARERVLLTMPRWDAAAYRRWAVPRTLRRWWTLPPASGVLLATTAPESGLRSALGRRLAAGGRSLAVVGPETSGPAAPILGLVAALGAHPGGPEVSLLLHPGVEDVVFGTPPRLYYLALHAMVTRLEHLYPADRREIAIALPAVPPPLRETGAPYRRAVRRVAEERHLHLLDPAADAPAGAWGRDNQLLRPVEAGREALAASLAAGLDLHWRQRLLRIAAGAAGVLLLGFLLLQWRTRRRLKRLIAHSTGAAEADAAADGD